MNRYSVLTDVAEITIYADKFHERYVSDDEDRTKRTVYFKNIKQEYINKGRKYQEEISEPIAIVHNVQYVMKMYDDGADA